MKAGPAAYEPANNDTAFKLKGLCHTAEHSILWTEQSKKLDYAIEGILTVAV